MIEKLLIVSLPAWCVADAFPTEFNWEKLGFASLLALIIIIYLTKFLPQQRKEEREGNEKARTDFLAATKEGRSDFLKANADAREDYLKSYNEQRMDFTAERAYDRELKTKLVVAYEKVVDALEEHRGMAKEVWRKQGFFPNRDDT